MIRFVVDIDVPGVCLIEPTAAFYDAVTDR